MLVADHAASQSYNATSAARRHELPARHAALLPHGARTASSRRSDHAQPVITLSPSRSARRVSRRRRADLQRRPASSCRCAMSQDARSCPRLGQFPLQRADESSGAVGDVVASASAPCLGVRLMRRAASQCRSWLPPRPRFQPLLRLGLLPRTAQRVLSHSFVCVVIKRRLVIPPSLGVSHLHRLRVALPQGGEGGLNPCEFFAHRFRLRVSHRSLLPAHTHRLDIKTPKHAPTTRPIRNVVMLPPIEPPQRGQARLGLVPLVHRPRTHPQQGDVDDQASDERPMQVGHGLSCGEQIDQIGELPALLKGGHDGHPRGECGLCRYGQLAVKE